MKKLPLSEPELILGLQKQNPVVLKTLYKMYSASLYGVISRIIPDTELAKDVLQETFVKIWQSACNYDNSKGRLFTWMMNIARNLSIDKLRSRDFKNTLKNQDLENNVHSIEEQHQVSYNPDVLGVKQLVNELRPELQDVLNLVYYQGFTQTEAAEKLQIPLGTVKTRVRLAITELRKNFN
ncbi:RNA polymerase sigma factor [Pedobacter sp. MW01-1-1]|uniref:RNA polymerase sigma factor n=1 Tax=Pedobacter sp. MW01-1-1 TaxID=3383027 RepID=UPI003FEF96A1